MVGRLASYSPRQPPRTLCSLAMPESVSPFTTTYGPALGPRPGSEVGVVSTFCRFPAAVVTCPVVAGADLAWGSASPRVRTEPEQLGQACGPWAASTFSATAICCSRVARSARGA